jgi:methyl-accepting chemotaxis protein
MASLGQKIIGASAGAALLCAATAGTGLWVAFSLGSALDRAATSSRILRLHMHADMMHDALRGDVGGAIMSADPTLGVDIKTVRADLTEHVAAFKDDIKTNSELAKDPAVKAALAELDAPLATYIASASALVGIADTNPTDARSACPASTSSSRPSKTGMEEASNKIEVAADPRRQGRRTGQRDSAEV